MKKRIFFISLLLTFACKNQAEPLDYTVHYYGALKNFMHKNDLSAQVDLKDFADSSHVYGLGALADLKGEVLIWDGEPYISHEKEGAVKIDSSFDYEAGLFVYSRVSDWQTTSIPNHISDYEALEGFIAKTAAEQGIDTTAPFPFLITGTCKTLDWHVINWPTGDSEHTHQKHKTSGPHGQITNESIDILGFYSDSHQAIFTHHTTNMHLHFKTLDHTLAGHVDGLSLDRGKLRLPVAN